MRPGAMPLPMMTSFSVIFLIRSSLIQPRRRGWSFGRRRALHPPDGRRASRRSDATTITKSSMKQLDQTPVRSLSAAEGDRQDEAAEPADHADEAADRADIVGVVGRDVLVDRGLAEAHEEAEHEDDADEGDRPDREVEGDRPADAVHDIVGRRQRQDAAWRPPTQRTSSRSPCARRAGRRARRHRRGRCLPGSNRPRAIMPAVVEVEAIDADQVARQPQRQRDEAPRRRRSSRARSARPADSCSGANSGEKLSRGAPSGAARTDAPDRRWW